LAGFDPAQGGGNSSILGAQARGPAYASRAVESRPACSAVCANESQIDTSLLACDSAVRYSEKEALHWPSRALMRAAARLASMA
jgi:hypothetical protein